MFAFSYSNLLSWFTTQYPDAYLVSDYSIRYFTLAHYACIRQAAPFLILLLLSAVIVLLLKRRGIAVFFSRLISDSGTVIRIVKESFFDLSFVQRAVLAISFIFLLAIKIYLFIALPYQVDEVFNFVFFIDKGPLHISIFSNNHVLYNLIASFWWKWTGDPVLASRLTSILSGMLIHVLLYAVVKYFFDFGSALFVLLFTGLTFWTTIYSVEGYSYTLMALCWLISVISLLLHFKDHSRGYGLYILSCVLGFYCSKLFIIPFMSTVMVWVIVGLYQGQKGRMVTIIATTLLVLFLSALLYLPMLLWSGANAFFGIDSVRHDFILKSPILLEIFSVMTEVNSKSYLLLAGVLLLSVICFRRANEKLKILIVLNISTLFTLVLFILITHVYPPSRAFIYTTILFYTLLAVAIASFAPVAVMVKSRSSAVVAILLLVMKVWSSMYLFNNGWQKTNGSLQDNYFYERLTKQTNCILIHHPRFIFTDRQDEYLNFYLRLAAIREGIDLTFTCNPGDMLKCDLAILHDTPLNNAHYVRSGKEDEFGVIYLHQRLLKPVSKSDGNCF